MEKFVNLLDGNRMPDMGKKWNPLIPYKHDEYLTPETLKSTVLDSVEVRKICKYYSGGDAKKESELKDVIKQLLEEIGFKRNMTVIRFLGITLNKVLIQMTSGVYVNRKAILDVKRELSLSRCPVLYLPSHRSYADFVLMSYMCFAHDLEIPAIAAGMDFHAMFAMGTMLRNTGAFFMRRSFSSDRMYWDVFREYIRTLVTRYHSGVEFFIEGTRSRSGKALTPKIGLFSMTLEPFLTRAVFDITIIPVGVSYDRPVEEELFAYELLGVPKPKETTKGLFKAFEIIESNHGRMFVNFGQTLSLFDYFERDRSIYCDSPTKPDALITTKDRLRLISQLSHTIVDEQQKLIVLTTFNFIAIYFNYRSMMNQKCDCNQLKYGVNVLSEFLKKLNALLSADTALSADQDIIDSLRIHSNVLKVSNENHCLELVVGKAVTSVLPAQVADTCKLKGHNLSPRTMRNSLPSILLQIYANPCLYWLHRPAFYVLSQRIAANREEISIEFDRMKSIFKPEFVVSQNGEDKKLLNFYENLGFSKNTNELSSILLTSIIPFVFCYTNVAEVIEQKLSGKEFTEKELFVSVQMHVEGRLNTSAEYVHPYCLSLDSISNALHSFVVNNCVKKLPGARGHPAAHFSAISEELRQITHHLRRYCFSLSVFNGLSNYLLLSKI